ncbi:uncharacterized protein LOC121978112 [Zingiber officinale]|uniref:uncharacterized protein LOC121978112 n=1 Tax=Zingiber officinale TaxID=94328 RepID=UPI001C4AC3B3|nr:uncharacterized protein LOC121978112 [Zingiber officinale]
MAYLKTPSWVDPNTEGKDVDFSEEASWAESRYDVSNGFRSMLYALRNSGTLLLILLWNSMQYKSHFVAVAIGEAYSPFLALEMTLYIANLQQRMVRSKTEELREELESIETWRCDIEVGDGGEKVKEMEELKGSFGMLRSGSESLVWELDDLFDEIVEAKKKFLYLSSRR